MSHEAEATALYAKLHTPNHYLDHGDIAILTAALRAARQQVWEAAAILAEDMFDHRKYPVEYRRGDFNTDYETAGDLIAAQCREQAKKEMP